MTSDHERLWTFLRTKIDRKCSYSSIIKINVRCYEAKWHNYNAIYLVVMPLCIAVVYIYAIKSVSSDIGHNFHNLNKIKWRAPSLSELTPIISNIELTHLGS